ncbi:hypothetical protein DIPPA_23547 [Diplonema papillatum]|nr:hypothetical protein DIPPA_23547 [Diplonema papillatum]|eukprot:gene10984-16885_t
MAIMDEEELQVLYQWVDSVPLSRPKRNIARDFADGMLVAEVIKHFFPKLVELHNYPAAHSTSQKLYNWHTLQHKVFKKLNFEISEEEVNSIVTCIPGAIERFLRALLTKIQQIQQKKIQRQHQPRDATGSDSGPGGRSMYADQNMMVDNKSHGQESAPIHAQIIAEKDAMINEMKEMMDILELKVKKLEQLIAFKDSKIQSLVTKLKQNGIK